MLDHTQEYYYLCFQTHYKLHFAQMTVLGRNPLGSKFVLVEIPFFNDGQEFTLIAQGGIFLLFLR